MCAQLVNTAARSAPADSRMASTAARSAPADSRLAPSVNGALSVIERERLLCDELVHRLHTLLLVTRLDDTLRVWVSYAPRPGEPPDANLIELMHTIATGAPAADVVSDSVRLWADAPSLGVPIASLPQADVAPLLTGLHLVAHARYKRSRRAAVPAGGGRAIGSLLDYGRPAALEAWRNRVQLLGGVVVKAVMTAAQRGGCVHQAAGVVAACLTRLATRYRTRPPADHGLGLNWPLILVCMASGVRSRVHQLAAALAGATPLDDMLAAALAGTRATAYLAGRGPGVAGRAAPSAAAKPRVQELSDSDSEPDWREHGQAARGCVSADERLTSSADGLATGLADMEIDGPVADGATSARCRKRCRKRRRDPAEFARTASTSALPTPPADGRPRKWRRGSDIGWSDKTASL